MQPPTQLDLNALMAAISRGDSSALSKLYDQFGACVFDKCRSILGSDDEAEDATQDIFIKIWDKARTYKSRKGNADQWFTAVIRNHCVDLLRKNRLPDVAPADIDCLQSTTDIETAELRVDSQNVMDKLRTLAPTTREIISLQFFQGYSFPEISRLTGIPEPTVKSRSRRALLSLRRNSITPKPEH